MSNDIGQHPTLLENIGIVIDCEIYRLIICTECITYISIKSNNQQTELYKLNTK